MAHNILENQNIESSFIEYKKSANFKDKILKTACAFANNYMNNEIGLLFVGIEEVDDKETGEKAIPKRPIEGIKEAKLEGIENELKSLLANIHPKINYHIITDQIDDEYYIVVAVESGSNGPFQTSERAEKDKDIRLKAGRYIRVGRDASASRSAGPHQRAPVRDRVASGGPPPRAAHAGDGQRVPRDPDDLRHAALPLRRGRTHRRTGPAVPGRAARVRGPALRPDIEERVESAPPTHLNTHSPSRQLSWLKE